MDFEAKWTIYLYRVLIAWPMYFFKAEAENSDNVWNFQVDAIFTKMRSKRDRFPTVCIRIISVSAFS